MWRGSITHLHFCPRAFLPMRAVECLELVTDRGVAGDRYMRGIEQGFYSDKPHDGRQVTLFEMETLEAIHRDYGIDFAPHEHRRNVTVEGVALNHLVGRRFYLGSTLLEGTRLSVPCRHIESILEKPVFDPMIHRSGLCCRIVDGGTIRTGDTVRPA